MLPEHDEVKSCSADRRSEAALFSAEAASTPDQDYNLLMIGSEVKMKPCVPFVLLIAVGLILDVDTETEDKKALTANHLDELLSLSELPMKKLLHVKRTFVDPAPEGRFVILINLIY
jgi:hypothetical protein